MINFLVKHLRFTCFLVAIFILSGCVSILPIGDVGELPTAKFNSPVSIALNSRGQLVVSDMGNHHLKILNQDGSLVRIVGELGEAIGQFNIPMDIEIDDQDNIYVPDLANSRVQKLSDTGEVLQVFGEGVLSRTRSIALGENGSVYALDEFNHRVVHFDSSGNVLNIFGSLGNAAGQFFFPNSVAYGAGKVYVADSGNNRIQVFTESGQLVEVVGQFGTGPDGFIVPRGVRVANNILYVSDTGNNRIKLYDLNMQLIRIITSPGLLIGPNQVDVADDGSLFVADTGSNTIKRIAPDDSVSYLAGLPRNGSGEFDFPGGLTVVGDELFAVDTVNHRVQVFDVETRELKRQFGQFGFGDAGLFLPRGITCSKRSNAVYIADTLNNAIKILGLNGEFISSFGKAGSGPGQLNQPTDVKVDKDGNVWVVDSGNHRVHKYDDSGNVILSVGGFGFTPGQFFQPYRIAIDKDENVYITDLQNHRVQQFDRDGKFVRIFGKFGAGDGQLIYATGIDVLELDGRRLIIVSDFGNMRLSVFKSDGTFLGHAGGVGAMPGQLFFPGDLVHTQDLVFHATNMYVNKISQFYLVPNTGNASFDEAIQERYLDIPVGSVVTADEENEYKSTSHGYRSND